MATSHYITALIMFHSRSNCWWHIGRGRSWKESCHWRDWSELDMSGHTNDGFQDVQHTFAKSLSYGPLAPPHPRISTYIICASCITTTCVCSFIVNRIFFSITCTSPPASLPPSSSPAT